MGCKHHQRVDPSPLPLKKKKKREPQVGRGLFDVHLLILHFKFQFSKSVKPSSFHIFLNLTHPLRKNISFSKCPKIYKISRGIWRCLPETWTRYYVGRKATLSDVKTALTFTPALTRVSDRIKKSLLMVILCVSEYKSWTVHRWFVKRNYFSLPQRPCFF